MLRRLSIAVAAPVLAVAALVAATQATSAAAPATCGVSTGDTLEARLPVGYYGKRIGQTLCFDFTGDGRKDIVFTGALYRNGGANYWAAFRARGDNWSLAIFKRDCCTVRRASGIRVRRQGRVVVVSQPIYAASDPICCPTGGTRTGRWRWNGTALKLVGVATKP